MTALTHGCIMGGTLTTPDLHAALADYAGALGLRLVEQGRISTDLAASWGAPCSAGAAFATLQPLSGAPCFIRIIEQPLPAVFRPMRSYGWAAFECTVQDVFGWPARLAGSGFNVIGPPREIAGLPFFTAMQMTGRGREMIYLNEVHQNMAATDLPKAHAPVDHIFIVILACADRVAALQWYRDRLKLDIAESYTINYTMINTAFGLADGTLSTITMLQKARLPIIEVDGYPQSAHARCGDPHALPPGNAMVTLAVAELDALDLPFVAPPSERDGPFYQGRRSANARGPAGELLELIEIG